MTVDGGKLSAARDRPKTFRGIRRGLSAGDGEKKRKREEEKKRRERKRTICQNVSRLLLSTLPLSLSLPLLLSSNIDDESGAEKFVRSGIKFLRGHHRLANKTCFSTIPFVEQATTRLHFAKPSRLGMR